MRRYLLALTLAILALLALEARRVAGNLHHNLDNGPKLAEELGEL